MLSLKNIIAIGEVLVLKYKNEEQYLRVRHNSNTNAIEFRYESKISFSMSRWGFIVGVTIKDSAYDEKTYEKINIFGPLSKIYKLVHPISKAELAAIRDKQKIELLTSIDKMINLNSVQFEDKVLGGKK